MIEEDKVLAEKRRGMEPARATHGLRRSSLYLEKWRLEAE
jgi:hypothetical protein